MKRFYLPVGIAALTAVLTLSAGAAVEAGWHTLNGHQPEQTAPVRRQLTPKERHLERIGAVNPDAKIQPVHDGLQRLSPIVDMQPAYVMAKTIESPRAHLYAVVSRTTSMVSADQAYLAEINSSTRVVTPKYYGAIYATSQGDSYVYQGAGYRDGKIYIPQLIQDAQGLNIYWNEVDAATGVQTNRYSYGADLNCDAYSICYDNVNDVFYTLSFTADSDSHLGKVDPKDGFKYTYLGHLGTNQFFAGLAFNPHDNRIYAFDDDTNVYTINLRDNSVVRAGQLDIDYSLFAANANAAITYSPMDEAFVCIFRDNSTGSNRLVFIDPYDFSVTDAGALAGKQDIFISAIACTDEFAQAEAPELPAEMDIYFQDADLTGELSFTVPTLTYYGVEIPKATPIRTLIKAGDIVVYDANHHAGDKVDITPTLPEGFHLFELTCAIGNYVSPARKQWIYVGNDNPMHPLKVHVEKNLITWMTPGFQGQHDGYVDAWAITYDVYFDGVKQNAEPLTECRFEFNPPADMTRVDVSVVATANGHSSLPAVLNCVIGSAYSLPYSAMPDQAGADLFSTENTNNDAAKWFFTSKSGTDITGWACPMSYYSDSDDWLFLPLIHFDNKEKMYQLSFDAASLFSKSCVESIEVYLGTHPSSIGMGDKIVYSNSDLTVTPEGTHVEIRFAVPEAGDYILAIRDCSKKSKGAQGMFVNNFLVQQLSASSAVPGNPSKVNVVPAPLGAKQATLQITLPTADLVGNTLPASSSIKATATCFPFAASAEGHPGETVNLDVRVPKSGFNVFSLVLSNEAGEGRVYTYSTYVGTDKPLHPDNIRHTVAEDNLSIQLLWDAPGSVGANGGYVDVDNLLYDVYIRNGVAFSRVGTTDKLTVKFEPTSPVQTSYHVTVGARNEGGTSEDSQVLQEVIGRPHELPILEEFNTTNFTVMPYSQKLEGVFAGSRWENVSDGVGFGLGNGSTPVQGGVIAYSESGGATQAKLTLPKFSTKGYEKLTFTVRYWDYLYAPTFHIVGRTFDNLEGSAVANIVPKKSLNGQWVEYTCTIPDEFLDKNWVELAFQTRLSGYQTEYLFIDSWQVAPEVDYDLKVRSISGPEQVTVGENVQFAVNVVNSGQLRNSGKVRIELQTETGGVVESKTLNTASLNLNQEYTATIPFEINGAFTDSKNLVVHAVVEATNGDQILNNNTRDMKVAVKQSQLPVVKILRQSSYDEESGEFKGRIVPPSTTYGDFEDFEFYTPFVNTARDNNGQLGKWKTVDLDGLYPLALGSGNLELKWEGYAMPCSWTVINPEEAGFPNDERLNAHSGGNCLMARSATDPNDPDTPHQSSDWLISPEVKGGTPVTFWFNTIASDYTEYIEIWYSSEGTNVDPFAYPLNGGTVCGDFIKLRPFHKVGTDVWEKVTFQLPDDAKYFAIVYTSFDSAAAMIDDIEFTPATLDKWDIDHYEVWRSVDHGEPELVEENLVGTSFTDMAPTDKFVQYWVYVCVLDADGNVRKGPKSAILKLNSQFDYSGVAGVATLKGISGSKGEILANGLQGQPLTIYSMEGALLKATVPTSDAARIPMQKGIYIVTTPTASTKVVVK